MQKKVPERTCMVCREKQPKKGLIRIVRTPEGKVVIDPSGKKAGRGSYICYNCAHTEDLSKSKRLESALKVDMSVDEKEKLQQELLQYGTEYE